MFKEHKKLYKAGKNWLTATLTVAAVALFAGVGAQNAHADDVTANQVQVSQPQADQSQAQQNTANQDQNQSQVNNNQQANDETNLISQQSNQTDDQMANLTVSQPKASNGNQWTRFGGGWSYTDSNGNWVYNQWQNINNNWYYFNNGGYAQTGWYQSGAGNWYYFDNNNANALTGWQRINNNWYYFDPTNAWADRGWFQSGAGNWYYFDWNNAWALTNWQNINGNWYYFDNNNAWALTGWQKINGQWYYFDPTNTWMLTGWQNINGKNYHLTSSGAWDGQTSDNQQANTPGRWLHDGGNYWEYVKSDGTQAENEWLTINGKRYYFNGSGYMAHDGWETTYPTKKDYTIGHHSITYHFDEDGQIDHNEWLHDGGNYWEYVKSDGTQAENEWLTINGKRYYFNGSGYMAHDGWETTYPTKKDYTIGHHSITYHFDEDGQIDHNEWLHDGGNYWEYVKSDGTQAENEWLTINGKRYYFNGSGYMAHDGWETTYPTKKDYSLGRNSVQYYFDENGQVVR